MKTLNKLILGMMIFTATAQAGDAPPVDANVNVTRDRIQQVIEQLLTRGSNIGFSVSDYRDWAPKFKKKVAAALEKYEKVVQSEIVPAAVIWANRYDEIEVSNAYSPAQKIVLLASVNAQADSNYELLGQRHAKALNDLYMEIFNGIKIEQKYHGDTVSLLPRAHRKDPNSYSHSAKMSFDYAGKSYAFSKQVSSGDPTPLPAPQNACYEVRFSYSSYGSIYTETLNLAASIEATEAELIEKIQSLRNGFRTLMNYEMKSTCKSTLNKMPDDQAFAFFFEEGKNNSAQIFQQIIYPILREPCKSSMCLSLVAGDLNFTRALINSTIDQPIEISRGKFKKRIKRAAIGISEITEMFNRVDYPAENLPFDTN